MNYANEILLYLLEQIKSEADLTPEKTGTEKKAMARFKKERYPESKEIVESSTTIAYRSFMFPIDRIIYLSEKQVKEFKEKFGRDIEDILKVFKNKKILLDCRSFYNKSRGLYYGLILPENFDSMYKKHKTIFGHDDGMTQGATKKQIGGLSNGKDKENEKKYWIKYTTNRVVILNDKYIINKMQLNRPSDEWFQYIFDHPGKNITIEEIRKETRREGNGFIKFLNNIKFKEQLRELFFEQGKKGIIFHNPITGEDLNKKLIDNKKLDSQIKKLKKINSQK